MDPEKNPINKPSRRIKIEGFPSTLTGGNYCPHNVSAMLLSVQKKESGKNYCFFPLSFSKM
jgi:hypothetical protein